MSTWLYPQCIGSQPPKVIGACLMVGEEDDLPVPLQRLAHLRLHGE